LESLIKYLEMGVVGGVGVEALSALSSSVAL
jgi:hypothetical protein